jgi:hypothetical protein
VPDRPGQGGRAVLHRPVPARARSGEDDTQADSLKASGVTRIFVEKISTRAVTRPELDKAKAAAAGVDLIVG